MSGNSTRLGVSLAETDWPQAASALGLIALFVAGAAAGSLVVLGGGAERQPWLLLIEAVLLAGAGLCHAYGLPGLAIAGIVLAMGLENAVFQIQGGAGLDLTSPMSGSISPRSGRWYNAGVERDRGRGDAALARLTEPAGREMDRLHAP